MPLLILIILCVLLFGGSFGTYHTWNAYGPAYGGGLGLILLIVLIVILLRNL